MNPATEGNDDDPLAALKALKAQRSAPTHNGDPLEELKALKAAAKPGVLARAGQQIVGGITQAVTHPIDTAENLVVQPLKSFFTATVAPGVGDARPDARLSKGGNSSGRPIDTTPYDAQHGGVSTKERSVAGVQSVVNAAFPAVSSLATRQAARVASPSIAKIAGLATAGAAEGAAYNPDDPAAGAVSGAVLTPMADAAVRGAAKGVDLGNKVRRIRNATPLGENALAQSAKIEATDTQNYGKAAAEAQANGGTSKPLQDALDHELVQSFADKFRRSSVGKNADDATVAAETYKLMSKQRKGLQSRIDRDGYDADIDLQIQDLKAGQKILKNATTAASQKPPLTVQVPGSVHSVDPSVTPGRESMAGPVSDKPLAETTAAPSDPTLRQALRDFPQSSLPPKMQGPGGPAFQLGAKPERVTPGVRIETPPMRVQVAPAEDVPPVMPSFPKAVAEHARLASNRKEFNVAADATQRIIRGTPIKAAKLDGLSPEAFMLRANGLAPEQAQAALEGTLGRAQEMSRVHTPTPHSTAWGTVTSVARPVLRAKRIGPYIDALDRQAGNSHFSPDDWEIARRNIGLINPALVKDPQSP